jgi:hypothetical protein
MPKRLDRPDLQLKSHFLDTSPSTVADDENLIIW